MKEARDARMEAFSPSQSLGGCGGSDAGVAQGGGKHVCCCLPDHHRNTHLQVKQYRMQKAAMASLEGGFIWVEGEGEGEGNSM